MRRAIFFAATLAAALFAPARAELQVDHVRLSAVLEAPLKPGATVWAAVHQSIEPGWHTYWKNPGETGEATELHWHLPRGVTAGPIVWPAPQLFADGGVVSYGYGGEATLLVPLTATPDARPGTAQVDVALLECEHVCIPEQATLDLDLTTASGAAVLFTAARKTAPQPFRGEARLDVDSHQIVMMLTSAVLRDMPAGKSYFYPATTGVVDYDQPAGVEIAGDTLTWRAARWRDKPVGALDGVLSLPGGAYRIHATALAGGGRAPVIDTALLTAMLMAFLGGLVLNLMPCVLPILSMKALALARAGSSGALRRDGLFYFAGVMSSFALIAGLLLSLKAGGAALGWGFQLQTPAVVLVLALLTGAIGLNLLGAFEMPLALAGAGEGLTHARRGWGAFFTGVLAVVVASPCTAPFMGAALGYALSQPPLTSAAVFLALGIGFALPFTALAFAPGLVRLIPKPGPWMVRFRQALAFPMLGTAIWLLWVLGRESGAGGIAAALSIALGLVFLTWLLPMTGRGLRAALSGVGLAVLLFAVGTTSVESGATWRAWSSAAVDEALKQGHPVLVDFSAAWCVTCLVNERSTLQNDAVVRRLRDAGVVLLKADWTSRDAAITSELGRFGRSGVPFYLLYPAKTQSHPIILPQILTPGTVTNAVRTATAR